MFTSRIFLLVFFTPVFTYPLHVQELITRCLHKRREVIYVSCPENHVVYQPQIFLGVHRNRTNCNYQDGYCTGLSYGLMKQRNKCHWSKSCHFSWRQGDVILSADENRCIGTKPNYVAYINPRCVQKDHVFNICNKYKKIITAKHGILRSHEEYPWAYGSTLGTCAVEIKLHSRHQLKLQLDDVQTRHGDYLSIHHIVNGSSHTICNGTNCSGGASFRPVVGGSVEILFVSCPGATIARGFTMRYEQSSYSATVNNIQPYVRSTSITSENDDAIIEECMNHKTDKIELKCPDGQVIYKPNLMVGSSNYDVCYSKPGDCEGQVHTILTQQNDCYWANRCEVSWTGNIPITMFAHQPCLSLLPSYIKMSRFQCLEKDHVHDICDKSSWVIQQMNGVIRSHKIYPWNYKAETIKCRKRIRVNRNYGLRLYTDDFDLDIDSRKERVNIWHVTPDGRTKNKLKKLRGQGRAEIVVSDGCIDIEFKLNNLSKTGRGFVILFEGAVKPEEPQTVLNDFDNCGGKATFLRRKVNAKRKKNKGKFRSILEKDSSIDAENKGRWRMKKRHRKRINRIHRNK